MPASSPFKVHVQAPRLFYSLVHAGIPFPVGLEVSSEVADAGAALQLSLPPYAEFEPVPVQLAEGGRRQPAHSPTCMLADEEFRRLEYPATVTLRASVGGHRAPVVPSATVEVLPPRAWYTPRRGEGDPAGGLSRAALAGHRHEISLAGFANPRADAIVEAVAAARSFLSRRMPLEMSWADAREAPHRELDPDPGACEKAVHALYDYLLERHHIHYEYEPRSHGLDWQEVRWHHEVLGGHGTCVDLVVLFAALLEEAHQDPVIIVVEMADGGQHAIVAAWREGMPRDLQDESYYGPLITDQDLVREWVAPSDGASVDDATLIALDARGFSRKKEFPHGMRFHEARQQAVKDIEKNELVFALDVAAAREAGVNPLPIRLAQAAPPAGRPFYVPFKTDPHFVGRRDDLARLHEALAEGRALGLVGMGGIGKTQLAVEYCHAHADEYPRGVFWIDGTLPLLHGLADVAVKLNRADEETPLAHAAEEAWRYLRADGGEGALVVFDNVHDPRELDRPVGPDLIPSSLPCRKLFTTRMRSLPVGSAPFEVGALSIDAARKRLLVGRPEAREEHHPEWAQAATLCWTLGRLPLALVLTAAFLEENPEVGIADYLDRLRHEGRLTVIDDSELEAIDLPTRHEVAVQETLRSQWECVTDENARRLFLAAGQFPESSMIPKEQLALLTGLPTHAPPGHRVPLDRAVRELDRWSLIDELSDERLRLHPLVADFSAGHALVDAGQSAEELRAAMAGRLADALWDPDRMESQVARRGVYDVLEDVRTGLWLLSRGGDGR